VLLAYRFSNKPITLSIPKIANSLGVSPRTAMRWIAELAATGHIGELPTRKGTVNKYILKSSDTVGTSDCSDTGTPSPEVVTQMPGSSDSSVTGLVTALSPYTRIRTRYNSRNVRGTAEREKIEASDEFLTLHQKTTGWSFQLVAADLARAITTVGKQNQTALFANYKYALTQPSIEKPLAYAVKQMKLERSGSAA